MNNLDETVLHLGTLIVNNVSQTMHLHSQFHLWEALMTSRGMSVSIVIVETVICAVSKDSTKETMAM